MHVANALAVDERGDGHRRMIRVQLDLTIAATSLTARPDLRVVAVLETFHLVADAPEQQRGMILIAKHKAPRALELCCDLCGIVVVETVTLVSEPDAGGYRQAKAFSLIEQHARRSSSPRTFSASQVRMELAPAAAKVR